jgi:hypothetical protein
LPGLKRLADAFVVLGLTEDSTPLAMPAAAAFRETTVDPAVRRVPRVTPAPPEIVPLATVEIADPSAALRRRAEIAANTTFGLPDAPIRPDPPRTRLPP